MNPAHCDAMQDQCHPLDTCRYTRWTWREGLQRKLCSHTASRNGPGHGLMYFPIIPQHLMSLLAMYMHMAGSEVSQFAGIPPCSMARTPTHQAHTRFAPPAETTKDNSLPIETHSIHAPTSLPTRSGLLMPEHRTAMQRPWV